MSLHVDTAAPCRCLPILAGMGMFCLVAGCALFPTGQIGESTRAKRLSLPPIQTSEDAIQLEVFFVDRPAEDPLLGSALWREVDQIAAIPAETREILTQNGFQVGHAGSSPPQAVQSLLGLVADINYSDRTTNKPMTGLRKRLPPGVETEIQASNPIEKCQIKIVEGQRSRAVDFEQVRCMFRLKSARLRDGWIRIDFQPEIHHGELRVRHTPTDDGWAYQNRQEVDARLTQQFSLTMNVGEMAIITAASDHPDSMGDWFFRHQDNGERKQRLLIVRIADAGKSSAAY